MLLTRITSTLARLRSEERGAGMLAVIGLMAVSLLTTALVASSVVSATEFTTVTRAGVQSQAAAEAGVAVARAGLLNGTCTTNNSQYSSAVGANPRYVATVWIPSGASWARGCPPGTSTQVRILSTGYASSKGVGGASGRDVANLEVVLSSASTPTQIVASGPAIYAYKSDNFGAGGKFVSVNGSTPSVMVLSGNVTCDGGATGIANLVAASGTLTVSNSCHVTGNAFASGRINLPSGRPNDGSNYLVDGNVVGAGVTLNSPVGGSVWSSADVTGSGGDAIVNGNLTAATLSLSNGGTVRGNTQVSGAVTLSGGGPDLKGTLTAGSLSANSSQYIRGRAWIYGAVSLGWTARFESPTAATMKSLSLPGGSWSNFFATQPTIVAGGPAASPNTPNPSAPVTPTVPNWVDFTYKASDWTGFAYTSISNSGTCTFIQVKTAITAFAGQPGVLDTRNCVGGIAFSSGTDVIDLTADLAIIGNKFALGGSGRFQATTTKRLWLITPDTVADSLATCPAGSSMVIDGGMTFQSTVNVMIYTPCRFQLTSGTNIQGQIYGGQVSVSGGPTLGYVAVGLPGVNLDTGSAAASASTEADRTIVSYRNVAVGN